jgi:hypothetical protein
LWLNFWNLEIFPSAHIAAHVHEESKSVGIFSSYILAKFRQKALLTHI